MGRPSNVDVHELADRLVKEVAERLRSSPFAHLRNITRGEKSVKKRFSCGADTAKRVHALAVTILQEKGYVQFRASMGKQLTFCKPTKKEEAKEREEISTFAKFGVSSPSEVKARRKERQPDKADMEKDKRPDKQPDKRPAKRRHFLYKLVLRIRNQFATHEVPEHMQEEEESSSSSSGEEDEDSSSSSSSSSRKPKASSARSSAARKAFRGAKAKAVQEQHRLEKADAEEKKSMGAASEASANKAPASKADAEEKKSMGAASETSADKAPASKADAEEKKSMGAASEASADKAPASKADTEEKKSMGATPEASADKAPASKADAEEKKSMGATPEASADKAPASKADAEEKKSMEAAPEASANKAPASKILVAESSKALEAMAMSISTGASAPSLAEPVPNVPPGLPPLSAQTGSLYRHLAGSQLHPRDEVGNIIQQLVQLGDTLEAMQA